MADAPLTPCPKCGAPCTIKVEMRGGDHGWGTTDAERTTYRWATPSPPVAAVPATPVAPTGWQPLATAPDGQRVLLGPRYAPVVGIVRKMPFWADEQEPAASVIHYNGTVLVAGYHCSEWHPLPDGAAAQPQPQPAQPLTAGSDGVPLS